MKHLAPSQREFFALVSKSSFENPFSESRRRADALAAGDSPGAPLEGLLARLDAQLASLAASGAVRLQDYGAEDAPLLSHALLFQRFHRHREGIDRYILAQCREGDAVLPSDGAAALFGELLSDGFAPRDAAGCVAVFFQLRRAFHFISTGLRGEAASMKALRVELWNAVFTCDSGLYFRRLWDRMEDFSTLLLGETGTGKGAAADALGRSGYIPYLPAKRTFAESFVRAFLPINLSEFPEGLIESELFGHRKGSFTGAISDHEGLFSRCSRHGSIFLDEIGEVSEPVQVKLLRVLQQRTFSPVGGHETLRFDGRVIAATNQDLSARRADGRFRDDFYYRLSSCRIEVPALRRRLAENPGELDLLLAETVRRLVGGESPELAGRIAETLRRDLPAGYAWPGNVRELEQAARSVLLTGRYRGDDAARPAPSSGDAGLDRLLSGSMSLAEVDSWYCRRLFAELGSYGAAAARLGVDWRTVKQKVEGKR